MATEIEKSARTDSVAADQAKYLIHTRMGIAGILGTLHASGSMVTAYFGAGNDFILTSVAAVRPDQNEVVLDYGADPDANQRALQAKRITFVAAHERIRIQFVAAAMTRVRFGGRDAFSIPLPAELLRLQRREYFRVTTPLTKPLKCLIAPQHAPMRVPAEMNILDISCGGIAILDASEPGGPGEPASIQTGVRLRDCRIVLPEIGTITADILVRSVFDVTLRSGAKHKHVGCEFVAMPERDRAVIQRYINKIERERKHRAGGN